MGIEYGDRGSDIDLHAAGAERVLRLAGCRGLAAGYRPSITLPTLQPESDHGSTVRTGGVEADRGGALLAATVEQIRRLSTRGVDGLVSRRRDCHFTDTPCISLLKHLLKVQGGAIK